VLRIFNEGWFNLLLSTAIGLTGIVLAIIFYRRGKQVSRLRYLIGDAPLIGPTPTPLGEGLEIRFDGQLVPPVTRTSYGIWNAGTTTVYGRDIVAADPLRLELAGEEQILRVTVEGTTRSVIAAEVREIGPNEVHLGFDYLRSGRRLSCPDSSLRGPWLSARGRHNSGPASRRRAVATRSDLYLVFDRYGWDCSHFRSGRDGGHGRRLRKGGVFRVMAPKRVSRTCRTWHGRTVDSTGAG
jgi:hypothetical protein